MLLEAVRLLLAGPDLFWELRSRRFGSPNKTLLRNNTKKNLRLFRQFRVIRVQPSVIVASASGSWYTVRNSALLGHETRRT